MSGLDLTGARLDSADLRLSKLARATLAYATLDHANLTGVDLSEADFSNASLVSANLRRAKAYGAVFRNAEVYRVQAQQLDGGDSVWSEASASEASFEDAELTGASFHGALVRSAVFKRATLEGADLTNAWISGSDLRQADLRGARVDGTRWTEARFSRRTRLPFTSEEAVALGMLLIPPRVAHLVSPTYVSADTTSSSIAACLKSAIRGLPGYVAVDDVVGASALRLALNDTFALVVGGMERRNWADDMSPEMKSMLASWVSDGGRLVVTGYGNTLPFLNNVFATRLGGTILRGEATLDAAVAAGTPFSAGGPRLSIVDTTYQLRTDSLPAGSRAIYKRLPEQTYVAWIPYGRGSIVYLGYTYNRAAPLGTQDGGWSDMLRLALVESLETGRGESR